MHNRGILIILLFILSMTLQAEVAPSIYPFERAAQAAQFNGLLKELRCLVCQNQDLADSNASLAKDLRQEVYRMVREGQSDQDIMRYLTTRYGDFILFEPPLKSLTLLLWIGPGIFLLMGVIIFWRTIWCRRGDNRA